MTPRSGATRIFEMENMILAEALGSTQNLEVVGLVALHLRFDDVPLSSVLEGGPRKRSQGAVISGPCSL